MNCHNQEFTVKELNLTESTAFQHNTFELRLINQSKGNPADEEASSENTIIFSVGKVSWNGFILHGRVGKSLNQELYHITMLQEM